MTPRRPTTTGSYAVLLGGLAVVALAWWLAHRPLPPDPPALPAPTSASAPASAHPSSGPSTDASGPAGTPPSDSLLATTRWVIDGDTLDLDVQGPDGGSTGRRLRLANIDAPEREHPGQPPQCQSGAATAALIALAPKGTPLRVVVLGQDRYGRDVGEAWLADGRMLGAEIARAGLAAPITIEGQDRFRAVVDAARDEAAAAGRGLHDPAVECSLPARVAALEARLRGIPAGDTGAVTLVGDATTVLHDLTSRTPRPGVGALTAATRDDLVARVRAVIAAAEQLG